MEVEHRPLEDKFMLQDKFIWFHFDLLQRCILFATPKGYKRLALNKNSEWNMTIPRTP